MNALTKCFPKGVSDLTSPEEVAAVLRRIYPDNPSADVARRQERALARNKMEDYFFWEKVKVLLGAGDDLVVPQESVNTDDWACAAGLSSGSSH